MEKKNMGSEEIQRQRDASRAGFLGVCGPAWCVHPWMDAVDLVGLNARRQRGGASVWRVSLAAFVVETRERDAMQHRMNRREQKGHTKRGTEMFNCPKKDMPGRDASSGG